MFLREACQQQPMGGDLSTLFLYAVILMNIGFAMAGIATKRITFGSAECVGKTAVMVSSAMLTLALVLAGAVTTYLLRG